MTRYDIYKLRISQDRGSALIIVMGLMLLLTLTAIMAVDTANTDMELSFNQLHSAQAFYTAEAGLARAYAQILQDPAWRDGYVAEAFENGHYDVEIIDASDEPGLADTLLLLVRATVNRSSAAIEAVVAPTFLNPFQYAMFGDRRVAFENNTHTDSYNSDSGSYEATVADSHGDVGSNGTITLENSAQIGGDVTSAVEEGISLKNIAAIAGDTATGVDPTKLDLVKDADFDWARDNSGAPGGLSGNGYTYDGRSKSLKIQQNKKLTLKGGVYYFNDISVGSNSTITIAPGEKVVIYMSGDLKLSQNSSVNPGGKPADMLIYSEGDELKMENSTELRAVFYGTNSEVEIENYSQFYGSVTARQIEMENHSALHYDRALANMKAGQSDKRKMIAWREL